MAKIRVLQARRIFGRNYTAGQVVNDPPAGLIAYAECGARAQGSLICEFVKPALETMTKAELIEEAIRLGIPNIDEWLTKKEIISLIKADAQKVKERKGE